MIAPARGRRVWPWVALAALGAVAYFAIRSTRDLTDFQVYLTAGARALGGEPLYRPDDGFFQFKYLPVFALAAGPLSWLAGEVARVVWFAASFALAVLFLRWSIGSRPDARLADRRLVVIVLLVVARPVLRELSLGQTNLLMGVMILAAVRAAARGGPAAAGVWAALAVFVKPYAVLFVPWIGWLLGARAVAASGATMAAGLVLPAAAYGWRGNLDLLHAWYRTVTDTTSSTLLLPENVSLVSMWTKWIGPEGGLASPLAIVTAVVVAAGAGAAIVRARGEPIAARAYSDAAMLLVLVPLMSPQGWDYLLLLAAPAVVLLVERWPALGPVWRMGVGAALALVALPARDLLGLALHRRLMATAIVTVAALVIVAAVAHVRAGRTSRVDS